MSTTGQGTPRHKQEVWWCSHGSPVDRAERAAGSGRPLNLIRVMPAKEGEGLTTSEVIVVGGGVIGLSVAWRCAQRGLTVRLVDPAPGTGASHTAAGMLAPVTELHYEGRELLALNLE